MKFLKKSVMLLVSGVLLGSLSGCNKKEDDTPKQKDPLVIPTVDVENLQVNLPDLPTYNQGSPRSEGDYDYIDLYEVSDFHGAVDFKESSSDAYLGLARLATYFDTKRAENPGGTVLLSSGDMFQGSADSNSTRGFMVNYAMHYMGFDAMAVGNHEFDWTDTWLRKNANLTYNDHKIPYLGINILNKETRELADFVAESTVIERGDYKIGIIGAIGSELESSILYSCVKDYDFVDETPLINAEAARLRAEEHCDIVVLIEHEGLDKITLPEGVDAIFGGHAHENKTLMIGGSVPAAATRNYARGIAHIGLKINKSTKEVSYVGEPFIYHPSNANKDNIAQSVGINAIMAEYAPSINSIKNIELGTAVDELGLSGLLKNICVKSMFDKAYEAAEGTTEIDPSSLIASFHNVSGGIRDDIKAGTVTYGDVYRAFPFDNEVVLIECKGSLLRKKAINFTALGCYRLFETKSDIELEKTYYIVTTDYLALDSDQGFNGDTRLKPISDENMIRTGAIVRDVVAERIYELDKVKRSDFPSSDYHYQNIPPQF